MKKNNFKYNFSIELKSEPDFLGNVTPIKMLGVNQLFKPHSKTHRLVLTNEWKKYKKFLESKLEEIKEEINLEEAKNEPLMVMIKIYRNLPLTKKNKGDQRYIRDTDNLFKPIQDALQGEKGLWGDDKIIKFIWGIMIEGQYEIEKFDISIIPYKEETIKKLNKIFF